MEVTRRARGTDDGTDAVEEAARAWYLHRSRSEQKPICGYRKIASSTSPSPKPSRYKIEAAKMAISEPDAPETRIHDRGIHKKENSLLDSYEIEAICRQLDQFIEHRRHEDGGYIRATAHHHHHHQKDKANDGGKIGRKVKVFCERHALTCGNAEDVIDSVALKTHRLSQASFPRHLRSSTSSVG